MIGFYGYTVWLTYLSLASGIAGIFACFHGDGHPYIGMMFLLLSGLCDAFDGRVSRTKKNRTEQEKKYGIQIDSLSDLVAFGVLPCAIGSALYRAAGMFDDVEVLGILAKIPYFVYVLVFIFYGLAAMIRLAYFNVSEEEMQNASKKRTEYSGLPVTAASLIFPTFLLINHLLAADLTIGYYIVMLFTGFAFISNFRVRKPGLKSIIIMVVIGALEFLTFLILRSNWIHGL